MKLLSVKELEIPGIKVLRFSRFRDHRGFFTETYRMSQMNEVIHAPIVQINESYSAPGTVRGLHFQWNPHMGKLLKVMSGSFIDMFLDIRKGSQTYGKISAYYLGIDLSSDVDEWIWIPPGFAHGIATNTGAQIMYA